jgi:hypothetical protein
MVMLFQVSGTSDQFWNKDEFVKFLAQNQNNHISIDIVPEAICLANLGVYKLLDCFEFQSVTVQTWNPLEQHNKYRIVLKGDNFWFDRTQTINHELQDWNLNSIFFCFYHRPTAGRLAIASYASQYSSQIHFSSGVEVNDLVQFELDKLLKYDKNSLSRATQLVNDLPILLKPCDNYTPTDGYNYQDPLSEVYKSILVDLVVESHVAGCTFFPTEKTVRPMLMKKPFVVFGSKDYLAYLRQMGFRTFNDFWNEEYDGFEGRDRLLRIYKLINDIASRSIKELESMYWDMKYSLDHNYDLLMSKKFQRRISKI